MTIEQRFWDNVKVAGAASGEERHGMRVLDADRIGTRLPILIWEPEGQYVEGNNDVYQQFRALANHPIAVDIA